MFRVGIDVGGTFTDLVAVDDAGRVTLAKSASTPADPSLGVMDGLEPAGRPSSRSTAAASSPTRR